MNSVDYEYREFLVSSWDFLHGDTSGFSDRQFFRQLIQNRDEPALVVGCG